MKSPIIETKCSSCRRPYRGRGEWDMLTLDGKLVGITCPRCVEKKVPSHNHSNGGGEGNFSPFVHLAGTEGRNLTLQINQAEIRTYEQATELGQTLLILGHLLRPTKSPTPEFEEGPNLDAA